VLEVEIVNKMNNYLDRYGIKYSNEIRMGIGIPDLTFNLGADSRLKKLDDYSMLEILKYIQIKHQVTYKQLTNYFNIGVSRIKKYVANLAEMSLVRVKEDIIKIIKNIFNAKLGTIISVEAKLKDWKNGCLQAQRYLFFSDYSYLALPEDKIRNVDFELLEKTGIGLLSIENNNLEEIISPEKSSCCDYNLKYIITSEILKKENNNKKRRRRDKIFFEYAF
jgi:hypothetical protein